MKIKQVFGILLLSTASTYAGTITLVGGDAWSFHGNTTFGQQVVDFLGGNVAFINDAGWGPDGTVASVQGVNVTVYSTLPNLATLLTFSGVYFDSPTDCCGDPGGDPGLLSPRYAADLNTYLLGGGNLAVQDWEADPVWTPVFGFDASAGFLGGSCSFNAAATPTGLAAGLTGDGSGGPGQYFDSCFTHQNYDGAFFAANGFQTLLTDLDNNQAMIVSTFSDVPEPSAVGYMLIGVAMTAIGLIPPRQANR